MHKVVFSMSGGRQFTLSFLQLMLKYPADSQIIGHQIRSTGNISVSFIKNWHLIRNLIISFESPTVYTCRILPNIHDSEIVYFPKIKFSKPKFYILNLIIIYAINNQISNIPLWSLIFNEWNFLNLWKLYNFLTPLFKFGANTYSPR